MPQTQFIDRVVVLPVSFEVVHTVQTVQLVCFVAVVDVPVIMQLVFQQSKSYVFCAAIQFIDRVPDLPVVPQKRDSTVQFLNKVVDAGCARQLPMVQTVQLRSPTRSSTSLFSRSEAEVPQIQSSTEFYDNLEQ